MLFSLPPLPLSEVDDGGELSSSGRSSKRSWSTCPRALCSGPQLHLLKVVSPVRSDRLLPSHIPNVELVALVLQGLDVKPERGLDGIDVVPVEFLHDGRLSGVV